MIFIEMGYYKWYKEYKRSKLKGILYWIYSTKSKIALELAKVQIIAMQCIGIIQSNYFQLLSMVESTYSQPKKRYTHSPLYDIR